MAAAKGRRFLVARCIAAVLFALTLGALGWIGAQVLELSGGAEGAVMAVSAVAGMYVGWRWWEAVLNGFSNALS